MGVDAESVQVERTAAIVRAAYPDGCSPRWLRRCENVILLNVTSAVEGNPDLIPPVENGESMEVEHPRPTIVTTPPIQTEASLLPEPIRVSPPDFFGLKWLAMILA